MSHNIGLKIYMDKLARAAGVRTYRPSPAPPKKTAAKAGDDKAEAADSQTLPAAPSPSAAENFRRP